MQDNAGSGMWESYEVDESWSIGWFNPVSNVITEGGNYSFKAMLYLGPTLIDDITHDFCVNTASFDCIKNKATINKAVLVRMYTSMF